MTIDREKVVQIAESYRKLQALQDQQRTTVATMIRACVARLKQPSVVARKEGFDGLIALAETLEGRNEI